MGSCRNVPTRPTSAPAARMIARRPPRSPAITVSAAATPGGQAAVAGNSLESKVRKSTQVSTSRPIEAPSSIGQMRSRRPKTKSTAIGDRSELAAPNVAPEIALWTRFCRWTDRIFFSPSRFTRPTSIATSAPMTEVLAEMPRVVIRLSPMRAPRTDRAAVRARVIGSRARGWSLGEWSSSPT